MLTKSELTRHTYNILNVAIEVHKFLGPGLLESVYHRCMKKEMQLRGYPFISEITVPVAYKGLEIDADLRCDFLYAGCIAIELKSVDYMAPVFQAQLLTYMKLLEAPKGILINFNVVNIFNEGQQTFVNELYRNLPE